MKRFRLIEEKTALVGLTPEQAEADRVDYIALVKQIVRLNGGQGGPTLEDMEKGLRLLHALDGKTLGDILELEDADHETLCRYVRSYRWPVIDERLVRFAHTVLNATGEVLDGVEAAGAAADRLDGQDQ